MSELYFKYGELKGKFIRGKSMSLKEKFLTILLGLGALVLFITFLPFLLFIFFTIGGILFLVVAWQVYRFRKALKNMEAAENKAGHNTAQFSRQAETKPDRQKDKKGTTIEGEYKEL